MYTYINIHIDRYATHVHVSLFANWICACTSTSRTSCISKFVENMLDNRSGKPIRPDDVLNVVPPDSEKDNDDRVATKIGKFGNGLASTGLVSLVMMVIDQISDERQPRLAGMAQ